MSRLGRSRRELTCNPYAPVQSKRTFLFSFFFRKQLPKESNMGSILGTIFIENHNFVRKKGCGKQVGNKCPPKVIRIFYCHFPGLPDSPPRMRASQTRNKSSSTSSRNCCSSSFFLSEMLFHFVSIAFFLKTCSRKMEEVIVKST